MKEKILNRLLSVKSIITIILTVVFAILTITGKLEQNFMMVYTVIISFYFGTQAQKSADGAAQAESGAVTVKVDELEQVITRDVLAQLHEEIKDEQGITTEK